MKLLIVTQVMDTKHPILGFFHRWVEEFSKHCEKVHVICLQEGEHNLPDNVVVHSLGKDTGKGRLTYLGRFFSLIWKLRHDYDNVFVHMNQIYVIVGAPFWRTLRKPIGLWYAHGTVSNSLRLATLLTNFIFTSTPEGFRIDSKKTVVVGQGIDINLFTTGSRLASETLRLITVGRISPSKNIETLLKACALLKENGTPFHFKIVGVATTEAEQKYSDSVRKLATDLNLDSDVEWTGAVTNTELPILLQQSDVFIHDGSTNSLDKTLLEASLCGCTVISSNPAYVAETASVAPEYLYKQGDVNRLVAILESVSGGSSSAERIREDFKNRYTVTKLISGILGKY